MVNFLFSSQRHSAISRLPVMLCLIYSQKIWCANKAANIIAGSPCSCSACTSSLNHAWRCAEHTSPNQNGFMVTTFWERYTRGANLGNLGIKLTAVASSVTIISKTSTFKCWDAAESQHRCPKEEAIICAELLIVM